MPLLHCARRQTHPQQTWVEKARERCRMSELRSKNKTSTNGHHTIITERHKTDSRWEYDRQRRTSSFNSSFQCACWPRHTSWQTLPVNQTKTTLLCPQDREHITNSASSSSTTFAHFQIKKPINKQHLDSLPGPLEVALWSFVWWVLPERWCTIAVPFRRDLMLSPPHVLKTPQPHNRPWRCCASAIEIATEMTPSNQVLYRPERQGYHGAALLHWSQAMLTVQMSLKKQSNMIMAYAAAMERRLHGDGALETMEPQTCRWDSEYRISKSRFRAEGHSFKRRACERACDYVCVCVYQGFIPQIMWVKCSVTPHMCYVTSLMAPCCSY